MPMKDEMVAAIRDHLVRSGIAPDPLIVHSLGSVTWRDGSLGCPEAGRSYTQALVRGHRAIVEAAGVMIDIRIGARGQMCICPPSVTGQLRDDWSDQLPLDT